MFSCLYKLYRKSGSRLGKPACKRPSSAKNMLDFAIFALTFVVGLISLVFYLYPGRPSAPSGIPGIDPSNSDEGNLADIDDAGSLHEFLQKLHSDHGPVASFWLGREFVVSTTGCEAFRALSPYFDRPPELYALFKSLLGENSIQYQNGASGRHLRQKLDPYFSYEACNSYIDIFREITNDLASKWQQLPLDQHIPLRRYMLALTLKGIVLTSFGDFFRNDQACFEFAKNYDICWHEMESRLTGAAPEKGSVRQEQFDKSLQALKEQIAQIVHERREHPPQTSDRLLIDELIDICESDQEICDHSITYVVGGFHTTGNLLTWLFYFLATHAHVEERLYDEICKVLGDDEPYAGAVSDLVYTRQVIDESLRLSVLAPWASRVSNTDLTVCGHKIPAKTPIIQAIGVTVQDPKLWKDPAKFDPDRFSPENAKNMDPLALPIFGFAGKRKCPGYRFAYTETVVIVAMLVRKFHVFLSDPGVVVSPQYSLVTAPSEEIWVTVKPRK